MSQTIQSGRFSISLICGVAGIVFAGGCFTVSCGDERNSDALVLQVTQSLLDAKIVDQLSTAEVVQIANALSTIN